MKLDELHEKLKKPFNKERGFGVTKLNTTDEKLQNIHFVVPLAPPRELVKSLPFGLLSETLKVIGGLPLVAEMGSLDKLVNYLFVRREVVQSSRLEGTWSTIDHALTPGEISEKVEGKSEHQAVRSYANLLEDIVTQTIKEKEAVFTEKFICEIQKRIVESDPNSNGVPGKLRTAGDPGAIVTIGGGQRRENSIYNPTPASEVRRTLNEVLDWLSDEEFAQLGDAGVGGLSLPIRLAIGHSHFEAVHPFTDGNGRTGRALWPIQMVCSGYTPLYLSGYVEEYKDDYNEALEQAQKKLNYIPIIEFVCNAIIESDLENKKTKEVLAGLEEMWQERANFKANSGARRALALLLTNPIVTSSFLEKELNISKTASVDTINALRAKKIIRFRKTENRKRVYAAEELIQLLSRRFGSDVDLALEKATNLLNEE